MKLKQNNMTNETQFVEDMVELFSDKPFANAEIMADNYSLSYEALSCFFRSQYRMLISGELRHLLNNEPNPEECDATDDAMKNKPMGK